MVERCLLAVDGGGSKTVAVVADSAGTVHGVGRSGCGNHQMVGVTAAVREVSCATAEALAAAAINPADLAFTQYALAGADRPSDLASLKPALAELAPQPWELACDTFAGLRLASPEMSGVVLVCGSGTNAVGRDASGRVVQVGGYGWDYGDAAGGQMLATFALRAAVRSWEGREIRSLLRDEVPPAFGYPNMAALVADLAGRDPWQERPRALDALPRLVHKIGRAHV